MSDEPVRTNGQFTRNAAPIAATAATWAAESAAGEPGAPMSREAIGRFVADIARRLAAISGR